MRRRLKLLGAGLLMTASVLLRALSFVCLLLSGSSGRRGAASSSSSSDGGDG